MKKPNGPTTAELMGKPDSMKPCHVGEVQKYRDQCNRLTNSSIVPAMMLHGELIPMHELGSISHLPAVRSNLK